MPKLFENEIVNTEEELSEQKNAERFSGRRFWRRRRNRFWNRNWYWIWRRRDWRRRFWRR